MFTIPFSLSLYTCWLCNCPILSVEIVLKCNVAPMLPSPPQIQQTFLNKTAKHQAGKEIISSSPFCVKTRDTFHVQLYVKSMGHTAHRSTWEEARRSEKTWHWCALGVPTCSLAVINIGLFSSNLPHAVATFLTLLSRFVCRSASEFCPVVCVSECLICMHIIYNNRVNSLWMGLCKKDHL